MLSDSAAQVIGAVVAKLFGSANAKELKRVDPLVRAVCECEAQMVRLRDEQFRETTAEFKRRLADGHSLDSLLPEAFALVREAAKRTLGQRLFDVQIMGGIVLHAGRIAEMATGEGKTLVATCPSYLNAITGRGVHIVTVNDYLARRDAEWNRPIFDLLGVTVSCIQSNMSPAERQPEYDSDITYGTNNEFGFDYLRDHMKLRLHDQVQRRRYFAIVDEVDSVLIDEARTPLIIAGDASEALDRYYEADRVAKLLRGLSKSSNRFHDELGRAQKNQPGLKQHEYDELVARETGIDYLYSEKDHTVNLTERGLHRAADLIDGVQSADDMYRAGNWPHYIENALKANSLYHLDDEYMIQDEEVVIVDEFTGRAMEGRRWSDGLHQAVEAKHDLTVREETQTLATITFQNFFRLYDKLAGMTGTAMTEAREFKKIYDLNCVSVPPNRPCGRVDAADVIYSDVPHKNKAICEEIVGHHRAGQPVLVGTTSVGKSEEISRALHKRGVEHDVLSAKHHEREADIVKTAGQLGRVTVSTNMAGRGTDIVLGRFTRQELFSHWQLSGLAPKRLKMDDPQLAEKLADHWVGYFLAGDPQRCEQVGEMDFADKCDALREFWQQWGLPNLPFELAETVVGLGGLHVVGTERHEARRIDNQLRGRAGRQGDPGSSRFFLSLDDDLMRIFAKDWVKGFLRKLGLSGDIPLESRMVSRQIEKAQLRVEESNFGIRKRLLEYDEVMNEQRTMIYDMRQEILEAGAKAEEGGDAAVEAGARIKANILDMVKDVIHKGVDEHVFPEPPEAPPVAHRAKKLAEYPQLRFEVDVAPWQIVNLSLADLDRTLLQQAVAVPIQEAYEDRPPKPDVNLEWIPADVGDAVDRLVIDAPPEHSSRRMAAELVAWARKTYGAGPGERDVLHLLDTQLEDMQLDDLDMFSPDDVTNRLFDKVREKIGAGGRDLPRETMLFLIDDLVIGAVDRFVYGEAAGDLSRRAGDLARWMRDVWGFEADPARLVGHAGKDLREISIDDVLMRPQNEVQAAVRGVLREAFEQNKLTFTEERYEDIVRRAIGLQVDAVLFGEALPPSAPSRARQLAEWLRQIFTIEVEPTAILGFIKSDILPDDPPRYELEKFLLAEALQKYEQIEQEYEQREPGKGADLMRAQERYVMLEIIDRKWKDHLRDMDHLKEGIWLRSYGGKDPKMAYKEEGYKIFLEMLEAMYDEIAELIFKVRVGTDEDMERDLEARWAITTTGRGDEGGFGEQSQHDREAAERAGQDEKPETYRRAQPKIGRNDKCHCGSGKKYKNCHMRKDRGEQRMAGD